MIKLGMSLFELAEKRLIKEKELGLIPCYTDLDILEYAVLIRKWLDNNPRKAKQLLKLTKEELKRNNRASRRRYFLKTGR